MKVSCEIIRDLLPLYAEDIASKDTCLMVEKHMESCPSCRKELEEMKTKTVENLPMDRDARPLKKLKHTLFKNKLKTIAFTVLLTLLVTITAITIANLTTPNYIPYSKDVVNISENHDGTIAAEFSKEVSGYDLQRYLAEDQSGFTFHITAWNTFWSRNIVQSAPQRIVLNPEGEKVSAVYYYQADGSSDVLIYGKNQVPDGGVITLPRLVLGYYLMVALISCILFALLLLIFYRNKKARYWLVRIAALPASYIIGHLLIRGSISSTYHAARDFIAILAIVVPLYIVFLLALALIDYYRRKTGKA